VGKNKTLAHTSGALQLILYVAVSRVVKSIVDEPENVQMPTLICTPGPMKKGAVALRKKCGSPFKFCQETTLRERSRKKASKRVSRTHP
jgi:hypothetical protein